MNGTEVVGVRGMLSTCLLGDNPHILQSYTGCQSGTRPYISLFLPLTPAGKQTLLMLAFRPTRHVMGIRFSKLGGEGGRGGGLIQILPGRPFFCLRQYMFSAGCGIMINLRHTCYNIMLIFFLLSSTQKRLTRTCAFHHSVCTYYFFGGGYIACGKRGPSSKRLPNPNPPKIHPPLFTVSN